jgi:TraM recognition site of TraD and TraG
MQSWIPAFETVLVMIAGTAVVASLWLPAQPWFAPETRVLAVGVSALWFAWRCYHLDGQVAQRRRWTRSQAWHLSPERLCRLGGPDRVLLGRGFLWTAAHTETLLRSVQHEKALPTAQDSRGGHPALHGVGRTNDLVAILDSELPAQTGIVGASRSGKTVLLQAMATQVIAHPGAVIAIDPKGSRSFLARCAAEAARAGKPFALIAPAFPESSASMNMLDTAETPLEVTMRIQALMPTGKEPFFREFPLALIGHIADAQQRVGIPWRLDSLYQAALYPRYLGELLDRYLIEHLQCFRPGTVKDRLTQYERAGHEDILADALIKHFRWPAENHDNITASLVPTFRGIVDEPIRSLLSPVHPDVTWTKIVADSMVVYFSLSSLMYADMANRLGRLVLQDLVGFLGQRYAYRDPTQFTPITVLVDEFGDVVYEQVVNTINKGGEANARFILAQQSVADVEAAIGRAQKDRIFDNLNTRIYFRLADGTTAEEVMKEYTCAVRLPKAPSLRHSYGGVGGFSGSAGLDMQDTTVPMVDPAWLTALPRGHAYVRSQGKILKIEVPLLPEVSDAERTALGLTRIWDRMGALLEGEVCDEPLPCVPLLPAASAPLLGANRAGPKPTRLPSNNSMRTAPRIMTWWRNWGRRRRKP